MRSMKIGVIGCGKMGGALLEGIVAAGECSGEDAVVFDPFPEAARDLSKKTGAAVANDNAEVCSKADVILLCVKPQVVADSLSELGDASGKLLVSVAAGVSLSRIETVIDLSHRVIRVMPNTPALIGKGAAAFARGSSATDEDAKVTRRLLGAVGYVCEVKEKDLDAVTALSGSGPAYVFFLIEAMIEAAASQGLDEGIARELAIQTVAGAAVLAGSAGEEPAALRENVTSPNGTTFAALESFRSDGFFAVVKRAMDAAKTRSEELGAE